jgi:hypothetical protein
VNNRDVPNRTSAKVTPEPAPLIQESLKELAACFKAQGVLQPPLMWEKNPGKTTKRSWRSKIFVCYLIGHPAHSQLSTLAKRHRVATDKGSGHWVGPGLVEFLF